MKDIEQTRSRPYRKNGQATVESRNNHVVRKFAFHWRYDAPEQLDLLNRLWEKTYLLLNLFTPTRKPIHVEQGRDGRRKTVYDQPRTPCVCWNTTPKTARQAAKATSTTPPDSASRA